MKKKAITKVLTCFLVFVFLMSTVPSSAFEVNDNNNSTDNALNYSAENKMTKISDINTDKVAITGYWTPHIKGELTRANATIISQDDLNTYCYNSSCDSYPPPCCAVESEDAVSYSALEKNVSVVFDNPMAKLHIPFIANQGQTDESVKFYAKTLGGTVFITKDGELVYSISDVGEKKAVKGWALKEVLVGGKVDIVKGEGKAATKVSYFKGNDQSKWKSNIPTYDLVSLGEVYQGIELKLKAYGNKVEKLFFVKPNGNPESIKVKVEGAKRLKVSEEGELEVETGLGVVKFTKPVAYQEEGGKKAYVEVAYAVKRDEYSFKVGEYDRTKELVIDPLLASTFLGRDEINGADSIAIDSNGNVYVAIGIGDWDPGERDIIVSKLDGNLQTLLATTFLCGSHNDDAHSISVDDNGNVYLSGGTQSSDFPTTSGAYDRTFGGKRDAFVSKLDGNLQTLLASTFLGSDEWEQAYSMVIDSNWNIYVSGDTHSSNFPTTPGVYDTTFNGEYSDTFISKLDANLQNLLASTFLGGSDDEFDSSLAMDSNGNVYVAGNTWSSDFPTTPGAYDTTFNGGYSDAFVSKLDGNLQNLLASTFLGGFDDEFDSSLAMDSNGNVYVAGDTKSSDFPTTSGAYDTTFNGAYDAFVSKLDSNLQTLLASTFLGGTSYEDVTSIRIDNRGDVYATGSTYSSDFPTTPGAYDTTYNGGIQDVFVSELDSNLQKLLVSTFLGGSSSESASSICIDGGGNVYVAGRSGSSDFPTTSGAYDTTFNGYSDAFVSKFGMVALEDWPMFRHDPRHTGYSTSTAPKTNQTLWISEVDESLMSSPAVTDGMVFIGGGQEDHAIYALNESDGKLTWKHNWSCANGAGGSQSSSPAVANGKVFAGCSYPSSKIYALNETTGNLIWEYPMGAPITSTSPTVKDGIVFFSSSGYNFTHPDNNKIYALDQDTGEIKWSYADSYWNYVVGERITSPAVADGMVFVGSYNIFAGSYDNKIYAIDASDGHLIWSHPTGSYITPTVVDGMVLVADVHGGYRGWNIIYALNELNGNLIWENKVCKVTELNPPTPVAAADGMVFIGYYPYIYALNETYGTLVWVANVPGGEPAVADGLIFVGSDKIYALNESNGNIVWAYAEGNTYFNSPVVANGKVFAGAYDYVNETSKVYCFGSGGLPNINLINIYTTKTNSEYERVFKYETDFKIIAVLRNNGTGIGHIRAGDLDITINDLYEDKEIAVLKNSEEYDIPAGKSLAINFTWNCSKENATWNESGFTFIGKKFKANATFGTQSKEYEFYIDEFGIPEWLRNVNFVEPPLFSITEPLPDDLKGEIKHLLAADVDNDNKNELVLHTFDSENKDMIILYEYTADSKVFIKGIKLDELDEIQHMIVADLDNDKKNELLLHTYNPNENQHRVETYRCENGKFKNVISDLDLKGSEIQHMIVADVDNDKSNGDELVLHTCDTGGQHRVETYRCENGKFKNVISDLDLKESEIQHMIVADVDNDKSNGDELVLHTCDTGGQHHVETYRHEAGGFTKVINDLKESKIQHMIVADVDNDNDNELILHTYFDFPLPTDKDHWIVPYKYNKDTKKFEKLMKKTIIPESAEFGESEIQHMVVADIDNDNDNELLLHTHGIVAGHWIVPYDFEGGKFVKNDATKFRESEIKHMVVADVDNDNYNELVLHKHDFKHPVPPEVIDDNLESDLLLGIYNITKDRPEVEYHMMILYRLDEDFLRKNYENVANKAKNYGFNCGGFGNYYDYGLHESHQISTIQCWFPASNSPLANYDDPPKYILEEITAGDKDEARKLIQRLIDIFPKDLRAIPYTDPSAIYSPDDWWNLKHNDEILLSSNLVGHDGTVAHKNSDNERWARFDKSNKIKRADYAETLPGFPIGLSDLNHLAVEICPSGPSKKGLDDYPSTVVPGYSDEQPNFDYGFHPDEIDINSPMPQDVSYHYELVWQAKYLIEHYGFSGIHCDDTGRLIMDTSLVGHFPPAYVDDVWTTLLFPKPPSKSLYGTCENSKYCQKLRKNASPDGFDLNSYSNMLKHIRWQVKSKDTDKFLFTDPYFVPSDVEFENGEGEKTWWKSIHASTDVLSTDQFCIWHYSFARWAYKTFNSGYRVLRTDLRRTLLDQPDPLRTLPKKALAERPDLTRGVLLATAWANKVHCDLNDPRDAKLFSKAEDEWGDNETLVANYVKMRSKLQELYKDHDIGVPLFSDEESQELLYHKQFTNSNIHYLKDPTLKNVNVKGEYEFVGGKVCNLEEAASEPYTILYTLPSEYGEKGRILHVMNSRVISNLKENNKVPTDYTFMIKIPEGEDINNIYLASPDFYNENVDPDRDGNPTEYEQQNFISNITDKKGEFWAIVFENGQKYIKIKVPHVIAYTAVLMEFKELEESIEPAEEIARKYFPNIYQLQCDIDAPKNNGLIKVGYSVEESKDEAKIEYNLVFKDEDYPNPILDKIYDVIRKKMYRRIEDIEGFSITVDRNQDKIKEIEFEGTWSNGEDYNDATHRSKTFTDLSEFDSENGHIKLNVATWNHLFFNKIPTESIPSGCNEWTIVADFSLNDDKFVNKGREELEQEYAILSVFMATCPVDIVVEDPDGLIVSKESIEVPNATYEEIDVTEDGEPDDIITLSNRKTGDYKITIIPEPDAKPTDTYTLEVSADDTTIILAENVTVSDISDQPYIIESTETGITQPLFASFTYSPENLVVNETITFDTSDSTSTGGYITNYKWDFGDGSTGTGKIITHAYSSAGDYDVTLTVTDNDGATDTITEKIKVGALKAIYVPDDYPMIQAAVDAGSPGDIIIVRDGIYTENIDVNKPHLTIISENGAENCIVQATNLNDHVFYVTADYVNIRGFTVGGASVTPSSVYLADVDYCNISNNIASNNNYGIYLYKSNSNLISNNIASNNDASGICLDTSSNSNIISNNIASNNNDYGIYLYRSNSNQISNNIASSNKEKGITLVYSNNNEIYLNNFVNNGKNVNSYRSPNAWNSAEKITYTYNGETYVGYLGNYWDDYMGSDANRDGIGDIPYSINSDMDNYPLMQPWEKYFGVIAPTISNIKVSPTYALPGDSINISADVFDSSGVRWVRAFITKGEEDIRAIFLSGSGGAGGIYTGTWSTMIFTEGGIYSITISAIDTEGNEVSAKPCKVEILLDTEGPLVSDITVSPTSAEPGTPIHISAEVFDNLSGVWWVKAIINKGGGYVTTVFMSDPDKDGIYTGTWHTTTSTVSGIYNINISAADNRGNEALAKGPEIEIT